MDFTLPWIRDPSINQGDSFDRFIDRSSTRNIFIFWGEKSEEERDEELSPSFTISKGDRCSKLLATVCGSFAIYPLRWTRKKAFVGFNKVYRLLESVWIRWKMEATSSSREEEIFSPISVDAIPCPRLMRLLGVRVIRRSSTFFLVLYRRI